MYLVLNNKFFSSYSKLLFYGQVSLRIIAELLKHTPMFLKPLRKARLWCEKYLPCQGNASNGVYLQLELSRALVLVGIHLSVFDRTSLGSLEVL